MLKLGVNIDHVATLRQARYRAAGHGTKPEPSPVEAALECQAAGAHSITAHLREDRRHIGDADVWALKDKLKIPLNLEMAVTPEMVKIARKLKPAEVCLVPEQRQELTTEGGLDVVRAESKIAAAVKSLSSAGIIVSLFIDADVKQVEAASRVRVPYVEFHTGPFANASSKAGRTKMAQRLIQAATGAHKLGISVNAGHGLTLDNLEELFPVPHLDTLNIGHSIVSRAVFTGLKKSVKDMLTLMKKYHG